MCNEAFGRLINEWNCNDVNPILQDYCTENGIDIFDEHVSIDFMISARKYCKVNKLWFKNASEMDKWLDS